MVTEVTAFKADDSSIHDTKLEAVEHDALSKIKGLGEFNHATALAIIAHAQDITNVLQPICWEREQLKAKDRA
jgi:hypothetical protein